jgi:hypothetical protein
MNASYWLFHSCKNSQIENYTHSKTYLGKAATQNGFLLNITLGYNLWITQEVV